MSLKTYLRGIGASTLLFWVSWVLVISTIDPQHAGGVGFLAFYLTLCCALVGTLTLVGFYGRLIFSAADDLTAHLSAAFRQGMLVALYVIGSLVLQSLGLLHVWVSALFFVIIVLLEFVFLARKPLAS